MDKNLVKRKYINAKDLVAKFEKEQAAVIKVAYPEPGTLLKASCTNGANEKVKVYDGEKLIFTIDKKVLFDTTQAAAQSMYGAKGIAWGIPLYDAAVEINYEIVTNLRLEGNADGIIFWFKGRLI